VSRRRSAALAVAAAYAALAGLVAAGALTGLDQWAADNAMPGATGAGPAPTFLESLVPLLHAHYPNAVSVAGEIVTLPGQVLVSLVLVAIGAAALRRRGRDAAAAAWLGAWLVGTAIEVGCKHLLARPALYRDGVHIAGFDSSWPSGHTLRCTIVASTLAAAWPRARPLLALWLAAALTLLELAGFHTPSDIAGGLLLAVLLVLAAREVCDSALLGRGAALGARRAGRRPRGARS
jgi:membrane-associated phospholipid phosphatase